MDSRQRREYIKEILNNNYKPKKGKELANKLRGNIGRSLLKI
ncbi:hypothetical protein [Clostridium haemolyticum]|nr:hypothetical protein [Clostridium haemolyticum]